VTLKATLTHKYSFWDGPAKVVKKGGDLSSRYGRPMTDIRKHSYDRRFTIRFQKSRLRSKGM
jgi:hypothetical protein